MPWPEEPADTVIYDTRDIVATNDVTFRVTAGSKVTLVGEFLLNDEPLGGDGSAPVGDFSIPMGEEPEAPESGAVLFVNDDGTGLAQLCVKFPTGAAVVLASETAPARKK